MLHVQFPDAVIACPRVDLRNDNAVEAVVLDSRPDVCIHLAAVSTVQAARDRENDAWAVNLRGTLNLANAIRDFVPRCVLLFASSAEAYGNSFRQRGPINEDAALSPLNVYGATKAAADLALGVMAEQGLRVIRARPFNHTGPGQRTAFVVPAFARHIARISAGLQPPVVTVGNLDAQRDFLDVRDVCAGYIACIQGRDTLASGTILNFASGQPRRIGDILHEMLALAGVTVDIQVDPTLLRPSDLPITCGDATRARSTLGWHPRIPWSQTLRDVLVDWSDRACNSDR
jgi:GDP-4-dehydro-6-deoxy-D-mannose reductase